MSQYQAFSSGRYPVDSRTVLWRYFDFEKFCWLFEKSSLFHSRLDCLSDPFEGSVTIPYAQKRNSGEILGYMRNPADEEVNNQLLMLRSFVTCWHASDSESPVMWKLYACENRGVSIVSTFEKLLAATDTSHFSCAMLGPVEYFDFDSDDMRLPMGLRGRPGFAKRKPFEHEREVRGMVRLPDNPSDPNELFSPSRITHLAEEMPLGVEVPIELDKLVDQIVVSPAATSWFAELVEIVAARKGLGHLVRRSRLLDEPVF